MGGFEVVGKFFGKCPQCEVIRFSVDGAAPVEKHLFKAARQSWSVKVERREEARQP